MTCFTAAPRGSMTCATYKTSSPRLSPEHRGQRIAAALIAAVYAAAAEQASSRVYWTTQTINTSGRSLCDKLFKNTVFIWRSQKL
jgi:GNAT superfamily N-acetyltransferase